MAQRTHSSRRRFAQFVRSFRGSKDSAAWSPASDKPPKTRTFWHLLRQFISLLDGHWGVLAGALAALTLTTVLKLVPPAVTKVVIDYVLPSKPLPWEWAKRLHLPVEGMPLLVVLAFFVMAVSFLASASNLWGRWLATRTTKRLQVTMRRRVFEHAVRLPLHRVYQLKSGGVASILREDAGGIAELIFSMIYNPWRAVIQLLASLAVLAWVDWRLLLGSIAILPPLYFTHRTWIAKIRPQYREIRRQRQEIDSHATEAFAGMRVVRAFGRSRSETARFTRSGNLMARHELMAWLWSRGVELAWDVMVPLASAGLLLYGGMQVMAHQLTIGDLMMFLVYLAMLLEPLAVLAESATAFQNNLAGLDRVLDLLDEQREMPARGEAIDVNPRTTAGRLTFDDVTFHYSGSDRPVLEHINLDVLPGQMVALVGPSGSGKTTLCNLVARFFDPTEGSIELDGVDLRDLRAESYRKLLGIVEQDVFLFDGTVAENISYARNDATMVDIEHAARVANAHEFIAALPDGYQTFIGERGVKLSGGQRQRLAIARAVLADPRIFILDEATSNLDTESERLIQDSLRTLLRGRTSFVIAHRLSTIMHADLIVVLADGKIAEYGTHDELMGRSGRYRGMVLLQTSGPERVAADSVN